MYCVMWYLFVCSIVIQYLQCSGQVLQFGECKHYETVELFNLESFLGEWYEIERFPTWYEKNGQCASKIFTMCGRRIEIQHKFVQDEIGYVLHLNSTYSPGDEAIFVVNATNIDPIGIPISVVATDYTNYAVVFGCKSNNFMQIRYLSAWILSRNQFLDPEVLNKAHKELRDIPMASTAYLETVRHEEYFCTYNWTANIMGE